MARLEARVAVPEAPEPPRPAEPVWLVRAVVALFLVGFAAFVAREAHALVHAVGVTRSQLYWTALGIGLAAGALAGIVAGFAWGRRRAEAGAARPARRGR